MEVKLMAINCINCKIEMKETVLNTGMSMFILVNKKKKKENFSLVSAYVCTKCGRVDLRADKPEAFEDDI